MNGIRHLILAASKFKKMFAVLLQVMPEVCPASVLTPAPEAAAPAPPACTPALSVPGAAPPATLSSCAAVS